MLRDVCTETQIQVNFSHFIRSLGVSFSLGMSVMLLKSVESIHSQVYNASMAFPVF